MPSPRRLGERKRSMDDAELQQELEVSDDGSCCSGSNKRRAGSWTVAEDRALEEAVDQLGCKSWKRVSELVPGRTHWQCSQRWQKVLRPGLVKGPWTTEEDAVLSHEVARAEEALQAAAASAASQNGISWTAIAACIPGRTAKQCRERYTLSLDPNISRSPWTEEEDTCIWQMHLVIGNQWAKIRQHCPNRTENQIKSRHKTLQQAFAKDKNTEWTPELEQRLAGLALQFGGDLSKMRRHLPKELKGSSPAALMARCNSIHQG
jgi:myb proto-oncogene protein